jgi:hypothetical protein
MNNSANNRAQPVVKKVKKKQKSKDELDRLKQAEKKRRRLEKALATSAAIRSELEKKKQKKIEEQQRLDEEGAAIAEAVALHVLLGEDSDDPCKIVENKDEGIDSWDCSGCIDLYVGGTQASLLGQDHLKSSIGWVTDAQGSRLNWGSIGDGDWAFSSGLHGGILHGPHTEYEIDELSAGLMAAQAVSALQIREDACVDPFSYGILRGFSH